MTKGPVGGVKNHPEVGGGKMKAGREVEGWGRAPVLSMVGGGSGCFRRFDQESVGDGKREDLSAEHFQCLQEPIA